MVTFWVLLIAAGVVVVVLAIWLVLARARERHKQEMRDLVRGRKPSQPQASFESSEKTEAAAAAAPVRHAYPPLANANPLAPVDESMVSRAEQLHRELLAEVDAANRGSATKSRKPGPCTLQIHYVDADGVMTIRNVSPYKSGHTNEKMEAWCELRQERRTFFFSRIQHATHIPTGHMINSAKISHFIHARREQPKI